LATPEREFDQSGGALSLDFANTLGGSRERPREYLGSFADVVAFARQAGVLSARSAAEQQRRARSHPESAAAALRRAVQLREALFRAFRSVAAGRSAMPDDLTLITHAAAEAFAHATATASDGAYRWVADEGSFDAVRWAAARDALELLGSPERLARVRECASETCDWVFVDASKNRSRRWCDMRSCGNRAKARRHYARRAGSA